MAAIANLTLDQGATFNSDVTVKDSNGNPFNLTGYTASAKMATGYSSTRTRTTITCIVNGDPTTGIVTMSLTADQTGQLEVGRYVYDLEILQTSTSTITRVIEGIITVRPQVTL